MGLGHYRASLLAYRWLQVFPVLQAVEQLTMIGSNFLPSEWKGKSSLQPRSTPHNVKSCENMSTSVKWRRKALELNPEDAEVQAAVSVAGAVLQQTQQQKYSSPDSQCRTSP